MKKITLLLTLVLLQTTYAQIFTENFESCEGSYTEFGGFSDGSSDYFIRTNGSAETSNCIVRTSTSGQLVYTSTDGYYYTGEDVDRPTENPNTTNPGAFGSQQYSSGVHFSGINVSAYTNLKISLSMAARESTYYETNIEYLKIYVDINNTGNWVLIGAALSNDPNYLNGMMAIDTNLDGFGDGTVLTQDFQNFIFDVPDGATLMNVRIEMISSGFSEEIAFDSFQVTEGDVLSSEDFESDLGKIEFYPNPTSEFINYSGVNKINYKIFNTLGSEISSGLIAKNQQINIKHLTNGIYFLITEDGNTLRFIKK